MQVAIMQIRNEVFIPMSLKMINTSYSNQTLTWECHVLVSIFFHHPPLQKTFWGTTKKYENKNLT